MGTSLKRYITIENILLGIILFCGGLLLGAVVIEYTVKLIPCPLCIAQRIFFGLVGVSALIGFFNRGNRFGILVAGCLMLVFSFIGGAIALRQVWIQHFPPAGFDPTKCAVSFGSFVDNFLRALGGAGNCAIRDFTLFGLSLPEWSLFCFFFLSLVSLWLVSLEIFAKLFSKK